MRKRPCPNKTGERHAAKPARFAAGGLTRGKTLQRRLAAAIINYQLSIIKNH